MDFIQSSNKQVDKFGPGKHGFSAGNPTGGILATYFTNLWADGVQQEIINVIEAAGLVPSGATLNQLLQAIRLVSTGRLLNIRAITSSGTFTETAGTKLIRGRMCGGGGGGGGSAATGASQLSVGSGGNSGAFMEFFMISGFSGVAMIIGAGGTSGSGAAGGNGGATSFGPYTAPGGQGGLVSTPTSGIGIAAPQTNSPLASGSPSLFRGSVGGGGNGFAFNGAAAVSGFGGSTIFGNGPTGNQGPGGGGNGGNFGCGGAGALTGAGGGANSGGTGAAGVIIIEEYGNA